MIAQFRLTGPRQRDFYLVVDKGRPTQHEGTADDPDVTLTAPIEEWEAMQSGEFHRLTAWWEGRLAIDGSMHLVGQLEDMVS